MIAPFDGFTQRKLEASVVEDGVTGFAGTTALGITGCVLGTTGCCVGKLIV